MTTTEPKTGQTCPRCYVKGTYIRTRHFDNMTADVWMCINPRCRSYRLYWHNDKPLKPSVKWTKRGMK